jgi:adenosyl cobinamide kinase/adenosyl cobinamide phosphate guanylyltransferase
MLIKIIGAANSGSTTAAIKHFKENQKKLVYTVDGDIIEKVKTSIKEKDQRYNILRDCSIINTKSAVLAWASIKMMVEDFPEDFDLLMIDNFNSMFDKNTLEYKETYALLEKAALDFPNKTFIVVEHAARKLCVGEDYVKIKQELQEEQKHYVYCYYENPHDGILYGPVKFFKDTKTFMIPAGVQCNARRLYNEPNHTYAILHKNFVKKGLITEKESILTKDIWVNSPAAATSLFAGGSVCEPYNNIYIADEFGAIQFKRWMNENGINDSDFSPTNFDEYLK